MIRPWRGGLDALASMDILEAHEILCRSLLRKRGEAMYQVWFVRRSAPGGMRPSSTWKRLKIWPWISCLMNRQLSSPGEKKYVSALGSSPATYASLTWDASVFIRPARSFSVGRHETFPKDAVRVDTACDNRPSPATRITRQR